MATPTGREKLAALQSQQARAARQKKLLAITSGAVVVVLAAVAVFFIVGQNKKNSENKKAVSAASNAAYIDTLLNIPASTYDAVGRGAANTTPKQISGPPLTKNGKPEVLYLGAEFCPYCGMERWALTAALSRFGTFTGLQSGVSSSDDSPANIPTLTYLHAKYTSKYLTFTTYEMADRNRNRLQTPDSASTALFSKYDSGGSIPFIDYGNKAITVGATYQGAAYLQNVSGASVAAALKNPDSPQAQGIIGAANVITSQLCALTKGKPSDVCASTGVVKAQAGV
jgi:hypothetical protein